MTDLISKIKNTPLKKINELQETYKFLIGTFENIELIPYLLYVINIGVNHINNKHKELLSDWKAWAIVVIKNLYLKGKIIKENDIPNIIDDFIGYYTAEYENYCSEIISATEYDRDYGFVLKYIKIKIGN